MKRPISRFSAGLLAALVLTAPSVVFAKRHPKSSDEAGKAEQAAKKGKHAKTHKPRSTDVFYPTPP